MIAHTAKKKYVFQLTHIVSAVKQCHVEQETMGESGLYGPGNQPDLMKVMMIMMI